MSRLRDLQKKYKVIGDVRGLGLYVGIEFVLDGTLTPATQVAKDVKDQLKDRFILTGQIQISVLLVQFTNIIRI